jgi:hypothetical protein
MATIPKTGISTGESITAAQILNIIQALDGTDATDIVLDGIITLNGVTQASTGTNVLTIDGSGRVYKTGSYSSGGGGGSVSITADNSGTDYVDIQVSPSPITGTGTVSADLNASGVPTINNVLRGNNTWGIPTTASFAVTSSYATDFIIASGIELDDKSGSSTTYNISSSTTNGSGAKGDSIKVKAGKGGQYTGAGGDIIIEGGDAGQSSGGAINGGSIALIGGPRAGLGEVGNVLIGATSNFTESVSLNPDLTNEPGLEVSGSIVVVQRDGNSSLYLTANSDPQLQAGIQYIEKGTNFWTPFGSDGGSRNYNIFITASGGVGLGKKPGSGYTSAGSLDLNTDNARKASSTTWATGCDERFKENITTASLDTCYNAVKDIPLKRFTWKSSSYGLSSDIEDKSVIGWIAQDVQSTLPHAIKTGSFTTYSTYTGSVAITGSDGKTIINPGDKVQDILAGSTVISDMMTLQSDQMIKFMYGTIQKLQQKVEALEAQLNGGM